MYNYSNRDRSRRQRKIIKRKKEGTAGPSTVAHIETGSKCPAHVKPWYVLNTFTAHSAWLYTVLESEENETSHGLSPGK